MPARSTYRWSPQMILLLGGLAGSASVFASDPTEELIPQVDKLFEKQNTRDVAGCAVGIIQRGNVIYSRGFGTANLEHKTLNTRQTVFETASFSKSFTSACLAILMDEGKISPDDDLRKFVPEMHPFDPPIRIRDMVRCRSGLWDQVSVTILVGWENAPQQQPYTKADFLTLIAGQKTLPFPSGSQFRYSSGDYFLLGIVIERVSGKSLAQFARERIFQPLGMERTHFEEAPARIVDQRAVGHFKYRDEWRLWRPTAGGGGLKTCIEDLVRWDENFADSKLPAGKYLDQFLKEGELLENRSCLDVDANRWETDPESRLGSPPGKYRGLRRRQFTGGAWGFTTALTQFPDQEFTAICLSNSDDVTAWSMTRRIADLFLAKDLQPLAERAAARPAGELPEAKVPETELQGAVGAYRLTTTGVIWKITLEDGSLCLTDHLLGKFRLRPLGNGRFDPEGPFYATTQFVFARPKPDGPVLLTSQWDEQDTRGMLKFEPVQLIEPTLEQRKEYAGEFVSEELAATYRFIVRDGALWLRVNSRRWEQLDATVRDEFIPHLREPFDGRMIRFLRNERDEVSGLAIDYYRVKGVRFDKRK